MGGRDCRWSGGTVGGWVGDLHDFIFFLGNLSKAVISNQFLM